MEKYTDLEQALLDTSLAIITDKIATQKELNEVFIKYKALPRKLKRYSNYYSNEFLGRNVSEMYALIKDKLKAENFSIDDGQPPKDTILLSEPDLYYKEESFNSGNTNICFILGHSGSGKSMMARTLEGDDIDHIELDDLLLIKDHFTMDELKEYSDLMFAFFNGEGKKYYIGLEERDSISKEEYEDKVFVDFVKFAVDYAKQNPEKKFIIDGIWIYLYFNDPSTFQDYAVFIKGTSFLKSKIRVMKREMQRDKETLQDRKQMFGRASRNYLLDEDKINSYRSFFGNRSDTLFRVETGEAAKKDEAVVNELNSIDRCFVYDDADGIKEIMQKARNNMEFSEYDKSRIINEGNLALADIRLKNASIPHKI